MTLRDLIVSIDFDDIDVSKLLKVDTAMDEIESKFNTMGSNIQGSGRDFGRLGSTAGGALNEIRNEAGNAGDAISDINNDTRTAGNALDQLGNDGRSAAQDIRSSMSDAEIALQGLDDSVNDSSREFGRLERNASGALNELDSEAGGAGDAMNQLGDDARNAGNEATRAMDDVGDEADEAGDKAENAGTGFKTMGTMGAAAFAAITTAAGVAFGAIGAVVMESQTAFDRLEAKTATTGAEFEGLKDVANNVFVGAFGDSIGQVTDDVAMLKSVFKDLNDEELQGLAEGAYTISDLWGPEVKEVSTTIKNMTSNFKDLSEQDAIDILTTGFQKTGDYSDDLLDTFKEYSPAFATMGHSAEDMMNILISGADAGAWNLDKVGDAMKEFNIRAKDGSDSTTEAFDLIGLKSQDMRKAIGEGGEKGERAFQATIAGLAGIKDEAQRTEAGVKLFGTSWEDLEKDVVLAMASSTNHLEGFEGATERAANTAYDNFGTRMTSTFRNLKTNIADAFTENGGEELFDSIASAAEKAVPKIESLVEKAIDFADTIKDNWRPIKETVVGVTTAIVAFALIMGGLSVINTVTAATKLWAAGNKIAALSMLGLNSAMLLNPMTWIIVGIAALIAIGVLLYRNWDTVKEKMGELWDKMVEFKDGAVVVLKDKFGDLMDKAGEVKDKFIELKDQAVGVLQTKFDEFKTKVGEVRDAAGELKDKFVALKDEGIQVVLDKVQEFKDMLEENKTAIITTTSIITAIFLPALVGVAIQAGITAATVISTFVASMVRTATQAVITGATVTISFIGSMLRTAGQAIVTGATVTISFIGSMIAASAQAIVTGATITISFIGSMLRTAGQAIITGASVTISFIGSMIAASAQAVVTGAMITISFIGAMIRMAAQAVVTGAVMTGSMIMSMIRFAATGWLAVASMAATVAGMAIQKGAMIAGATVTGILTAAQWAWNVALNANPLGLIVIAIGLVIAIGYLLYKNWDKIKDGAISLWETIKEKFAGIKESISGALEPVLGLIDSLLGKWNDFKGALSNFKMPSIKMPSLPSWMGGSKDGSHATGLARVPFDGYMAELHKDEAVLTANQSDALRRTGILENAGSKPKLALDRPEIINKMKAPNQIATDTKTERQTEISNNSKEITSIVNTFAPEIKIEVKPGTNGQIDADSIAQAVKKEMEKFWMQMNLREA